MRLRLITGALLLAVLAAQPALADIKVAYVDVQRALNECDAGKHAKADFQGRVQALEGKLQRQQSEVQSLKDEIEKKGMLMNPDQRQNLQDQYVAKAKDFDREYKDARDELQHKDNEITSRIVHDLAQIIRTLGERGGYTIVLEKGSILWGAPSIDITDQVIRSYNATHVKIGTLGETGAASSTAQSTSPGLGDFGSAAARRSTISK
ncbi:MAG TPA: OmpH family outer membrane protein [Candidatus Binataceae bacterium]|nr:OmpH family outer membrane protein [Candidatus Binataceae bacterium]